MHILSRLFEIAALTSILLLLAGCLYEFIAERLEAKQNPAPGSLIDLDGRRLHLLCQGSGRPTVIIEQGAGSPARLWWPIQKEVAAFARVCTYDRAGYCWSDPARRSRSIAERAEELHRLLSKAQIPAPYLLVAHSYGGLIIRHFALRFPRQTAGLVLVDTPDEIAMSGKKVQKFYAFMRMYVRFMTLASRVGLPRLLRHIPALREGLWFVHPKEQLATLDDLRSIKRPDTAPPAAGALLDTPLAVITHGLPFPGPFAVLEEGWTASQQRLAALSSQSTLIMAENSNHMIHLDQPGVVIQAIAELCQRWTPENQAQERRI